MFPSYFEIEILSLRPLSRVLGLKGLKLYEAPLQGVQLKYSIQQLFAFSS